MIGFLADVAAETVHAAWIAMVDGIVGRRVFRANWKKMDLTYRHVHTRMQTIELLLIKEKIRPQMVLYPDPPRTPFTNIVDNHQDPMPLGRRPRHATGRSSTTILGYRLTRQRVAFVAMGSLLVGVIVVVVS